MGTKYFFSPLREEVKKVFEYACEADKNGARLRPKGVAL